MRHVAVGQPARNRSEDAIQRAVFQNLRARAAPPIAAHPTPIPAELSGNRRCSTLGIVVNAYAPVLTLARRLIRAGLPPDRILEVYRGATLCFRVPLAVAARLTVKDDKDGVPRFKNYVPFPADRVAPPIAPNEVTATSLSAEEAPAP